MVWSAGSAAAHHPPHYALPAVSKEKAFLTESSGKRSCHNDSRKFQVNILGIDSFPSYWQRKVLFDKCAVFPLSLLKECVLSAHCSWQHKMSLSCGLWLAQTAAARSAVTDFPQSTSGLSWIIYPVFGI